MHAKAEPRPPQAVSPRRLSAPHAWIAVAVLAALFGVVAFVPALRTVDLTPLRGIVTSFVHGKTGRALELGQGPSLRLSLSPVLIAEDVTFANAPWGSHVPMLQAKRVEVAVRALPLLLGRLVVDRVVLTAPDLLVETDGRGHANWDLLPATASRQPTASPGGRPLLSHLRLREVRVTDASLRYRNGATGREARVAAPLIALVPTREFAGGLGLQAKLDLNHTSVALAGAVGGPAAIAGTQPFPFHVRASTNGATATLAGRIARLPELAGVQGSISIEVSDPSGLSAVLGLGLPKLSPFRISADVRGAERGFVAQPLHAQIGRTTLSGKVTFAPGSPRPVVVADLSGPCVALTELLGNSGHPRPAGGPPPARPAHLFSSSRWPLEWLNDVRADVKVKAATVDLGKGTTATSTSAHGTISNGTLTVDPLSMSLGGGRVTGRLRLTAGNPPVLAVDLDGNGVALTALLGALDIRLPCRGCASDLAVDLQGAGGSLHEWMTNLDGTVRLEVGKGELETGTLDLGGDVLAQAVEAINPFHKHDRFMELRCGVVNVAVERGVVRLGKGVAVETSMLDLMATGTADLGKELLDVEVRSRATQGLGLGLGSLAGAVRVHGPLAHPSLGLNPLGAAESTATTVGTAAATGGLSIVAKRIWEKLFARSPCAAARRRQPRAPLAHEASRKKR
jgi:uncharacterized protein involved in outer membrane biogenesis